MHVWHFLTAGMQPAELSSYAVRQLTKFSRQFTLEGNLYFALQMVVGFGL